MNDLETKIAKYIESKIGEYTPSEITEAYNKLMCACRMRKEVDDHGSYEQLSPFDTIPVTLEICESDLRRSVLDVLDLLKFNDVKHLMKIIDPVTQTAKQQYIIIKQSL